MSSIIGTQFVLAILMYFGTLASYYLPIKLFSKVNNRETDLNQIKFLNFEEEEKQKKIYSNCNLFATGIFISMCLMNIPMVNEEWLLFLEEANLIDIKYPLAELFIIIGFFIIIFLEQIILKYKSSNPTPFLHLSETNDEQLCKLLEENLPTESILIEQDLNQDKNNLNKNELNEKLNDHLNKDHSDAFDSDDHFDRHQNDFHHHHDDNFHTHFNLNEFNNEINLSFFMLILASSIHSVFEGISIGLVKQYNKVIPLFLGIFLHEIVISFALGINASKINKGLTFGLIFSLTIPLGMLTGVLMTCTNGLIGKFISAVFQSISIGTFLEVAFVELMPNELNHHDSPNKLLKKISIIFLGSMSFAILQFISD